MAKSSQTWTCCERPELERAQCRRWLPGDLHGPRQAAEARQLEWLLGAENARVANATICCNQQLTLFGWRLRLVALSLEHSGL
jgi:hypothetical protein